MRITDVRAVHLSLPSIANRSDGTQDALIVRIDTDAGISGIGEAKPVNPGMRFSPSCT